LEKSKRNRYVNRINAEEFAKEEVWESKVIDIRKDSEYSAEHVEDALEAAIQYK
jgi:rhodanese-related sulfurtransferase